MRCTINACIYNNRMRCTDTNNIHKCDNWRDKDLVFGENLKMGEIVGDTYCEGLTSKEKTHIYACINAIFSVLTDDQKKAVRKLL